MHSFDHLTVEIDRIVPGGFGLAHHDGRTLLVPLVCPGDKVSVIPARKGPFAELVEVIEPGPGRVAPQCQHYGQCGGCDLMHLSYEAQLDAKLSIVVDSLKRLGGSAFDLPFVMVANPSPFGSRIRANWHATRTGGAGYARRGSNEIIEIADCPILDPVLERFRKQLRIREDTAALTNGHDISSESAERAADEITFSILGEEIKSSADAFFQANIALIEPFVGEVVRAVAGFSPVSIWDLYAGVGLFSVPLARLGASVASVESDPIASAFARVNMEHARFANLDVHTCTAEAWLASERPTPDVILVDPPRVGLSKSVTVSLIKRRPKALVYVSCDPATFAKDHALLKAGGFDLTSIIGFDLFPQTHHVEIVSTYKLN